MAPKNRRGVHVEGADSDDWMVVDMGECECLVTFSAKHSGLMASLIVKLIILVAHETQQHEGSSHVHRSFSVEIHRCRDYLFIFYATGEVFLLYTHVISPIHKVLIPGRLPGIPHHQTLRADIVLYMYIKVDFKVGLF